MLLINTETNESNSCSHLAVLNQIAAYRNSYYLWIGIHYWTVSICFITDELIKMCCLTVQKLPYIKKKNPSQSLLLNSSNLLSCWKNHNLEFRKARFKCPYLLTENNSLKKKKKGQHTAGHPQETELQFSLGHTPYHKSINKSKNACTCA